MMLAVAFLVFMLAPVAVALLWLCFVLACKDADLRDTDPNL